MGPIAEDTVEYLMTRGPMGDDVVATLVQKFLKIERPNLPAGVTQQFEKVLAATVSHCLQK